MDGAACDFHSVIKGLFPGFQAREGGKQGRVDIDNSSFEGAKEIALEDAHESREHDEIRLRAAKGIDKRVFGLLVEFRAERPGRDEAGWNVSFSGAVEDS
jgi:hypothetical protein